MKERLNLTIDGELLEAMKVYAAGKEMSVSELVENYFRNVTKPVQRKNILELMDELDAPGSGIHPPVATKGAEPSGPPEEESDAALAELEAKLVAWAKKPGPFTKVKKAKHGL